MPRTIPGFEVGGPIMTSDEVLMLDYVPKSVVVIGGGAIGCEFASTFADLGAKVTILEFLPKILPGLRHRRRQRRGAGLRQAGHHDPHRRQGRPATSSTPTGTKVLVEDGEPVETDIVVVSVGRRPFADQLGLVGTAVKVDPRGFVEVDELCRTGEPGVYALGDLINTPQLAHVGFAEAILVVKQILGETPLPVMYDRVPWAIYCHPEVAFAGHSEEAAKEAGFDVVVSKHQFRGNSRALIIGETDGLVKVIAEKQADGTGGRILGVHMVGPVGHRAARPGLPGRQLGGHRGRGGGVPPAPSHACPRTFGETVLSLTGRSLHG